MCLSHRHLALETGFDARVPGARMPFAEPGIKRHYAPDRRVQILHARVRLSIEPTARTFRGEARFQLRPLPSYRGRFGLDLDDVRILAVQDGEGRDLRWSSEEGQVRIRAAEVPAEVVIRWEGASPRRGLYFVGPTPFDPDREPMAWTQCQDEDAHFLMPCHDHPGIKHPWLIELDAPAGYTLLSNGRCVSHREEGGRAVAIYEQAEPMPAYLFTAVAARLSAVDARWRDTPVRYLVPRGREEAVARAMGRTPEMMEAFSRLTGVDFPWPRYDQVVVHDFIFGGMENVGCTTMTELLLVSESAALEWDPDGLVAHELAHQWFGDLVTCQDWSQGWLNESWATFMEAAWWEEDRPRDEATWYRWTTASGYFAEHASRYRRPIVSYDFREPIDVFDRHLYNKGSCVLWTLRHRLGEEGFWAGVHRYLTGHAHGTVHTRDFQRAMEQATGMNLDGFFHQWVHSAGHPQVEVRVRPEPSGDLVTVAVTQRQQGDEVPQVFDFDLRIELVGEDGRTRCLDLPVRERERAWAIPVDGPVRTIRVDPGFRVLAELELKGPEAWLEPLLEDPCPVLALRAATALLDGARGAEAVARALSRHPFFGLRKALAERFGKRGGPDSRAILARALEAEEDPRVRTALVAALGRFPEAEAADALLADAARGFASDQHRGAFVEALGRTRDPRARARIEAELETRSWAWLVQRKALAGLVATRDPAVFDTVVRYTRADRPDRVRGAAAAALATLATWNPDLIQRAVERLIEVIREPGFAAQLLAIAALGGLGDARALGALGQVHRSAPDGRTRRAAYEAMVRIRRGADPEEGLEHLRERLEALSEENAALRARVARLERDRDAREEARGD